MSRILIITFVLLAYGLSTQPLMAQQKIKVSSKEEAEKLKIEQEKANRSKGLLNTGNSLYRSRDYKGAIAKYDEAIKNDPDLGNAYYYKGMALKHLKKYDQAETILKTATNLIPNEAGPYYQLGSLYEDLGKNTDAINFYNLSLQKDPKYVKSYYSLGKLYSSNAFKNHKKAIDMYNRAIEYEPTYDLAYYGLGKALGEEKDYTKAAEAFENALKNTRNRKMKGRYYFELGEVLLASGLLTKATKAYNDCLKFSTEAFFKGGANFGLGEAYAKMKQRTKAIKYFQEAKRYASWRTNADYKIKELTGKL